ncbi:unnamed protein product [Lactuca saligna]|uniref:Uncharacterized protein n=1 Tax=Lactuca saligna TaxID=75948 RepID=A0AA36E273_LACSI|nr:unnamed protein product [Lactuca saligna]
MPKILATTGGNEMQSANASASTSHSPAPGSDSKLERIVLPVFAQAPVSNLTSSSSLSSSSPSRKNARIRSSLIHDFVKACLFSIQKENYELHTTCLNKDIPHDEIMEIFKHESDTDRRNIALYTVLFTLVTLFVL